MKRSLNATGRGRIPREFVEAALVRDGGNAVLTAKIEPSALGAHATTSPDAALWMQVEGGVYRHRVRAGTASAPQPVTATLPDVDLLPTNPNLRVTLVEPATGRLLATADRVPLADEPGGDAKDWLLPVEFESLNGPLWRLDTESVSEPQLKVERKLKDFDITRDTMFAILVLPEAVGQVVRHWYAERHDDVDLDLVTAWRRKITALVGAPTPTGLADLDKEERDEEWARFADDVAEAFGRELSCVKRLEDVWEERE